MGKTKITAGCDSSEFDADTLLRKLEETQQALLLSQAELAKAQQELQQSQYNTDHATTLLQSMLKTTPLAVHIWSSDFVLLDVSDASAELFGFENTQDFIDNFLDTIPEYQANGEKSEIIGPKYFAQAFEVGKICKDWVHLHKNGDEIPCEITITPANICDTQMVFVFVKDLRERNSIVNKLEESNTYGKVMLDASPIGTMIWDNQGNPVGCNTAMYKTFGLQNQQDFMLHMHKLYPEFQPDGTPSLQKIHNELHKAFTEGHTQGFWMGSSINGEEIPTEVIAVRTKHNGQDMVVVFYRDLREVEENIRKTRIAEKRTEGILNGVPMGISMFNAQAQLIDCNEEALRISRYTSKDVFLANTMQDFPETQPNGLNSQLFIKEKFSDATINGRSNFELLAFDANKELYYLDVTLVYAHMDQGDIYIAYCNDLRENKKMLKEIESSKEVAEQSAQAKSDFLANMSHEIRTPMNGILGLLHILSNTKLDTAQQNYMQKALFSTKELLRIIDDILDFSKIEAGKLEMEVTPFTIHNICSELESLLCHIIKNKGLTYHMDEGNFTTIPLLGDPLRLKQVILNLLNNAIKFTEKGSISLEIRCDKQEDNTLRCLFKITDTGIGLSQEQIQNLFSAFTQADTSVTRKYGGTGLGLAISKSIVEMMQGSIWVESTPNIGSSFFFTAIFKLANEDITIMRKTHTTSQEYSLHSGHILLVEDNQINQIIAQELLQCVGYTVNIANNGQEALDMIDKEPYDIILMDIQMPIMDGLTATRKIRQKSQFATLPIVAMSAHAMTGDKEKSIENGLNDHITKPISPDILYETLRYWLGKKT